MCFQTFNSLSSVPLIFSGLHKGSLSRPLARFSNNAAFLSTWVYNFSKLNVLDFSSPFSWCLSCALVLANYLQHFPNDFSLFLANTSMCSTIPATNNLFQGLQHILFFLRPAISFYFVFLFLLWPTGNTITPTAIWGWPCSGWAFTLISQYSKLVLFDYLVRVPNYATLFSFLFLFHLNFLDLMEGTSLISAVLVSPLC